MTRALLNWRADFSRLTLARQFALAGVPVLVAGMIIIGLWVTTSLERSFVQNRADSTALFVDSIVSPLAQDLSLGSVLQKPSEQALVQAIRDGPLSNRIFSFKIWTRDATVAFSSDPALIGKTFDMRLPLRTALDGEVFSEFDKLEGEEHLVEKNSGYAFLEIYSPIRDAKTGDVIGSAEFYEPASVFLSELQQLRISSWVVVAAVTMGMLALLFLIVVRGSAQIERQRRTLDDQVDELSRLLAANTLLRNRVDEAAQQTVTLNERYLRRISSDLHDGPAQLLGFAVMRLEAIRKGKGREDDEALIRRSVVEAINEIRSISRGLQLPELESLSGKEVSQRAIRAHELHSGARVETDLAEVKAISQGVKICIYRFFQEVLSNASRHSGASRIKASVETVDEMLVIRVEDNGQGFASDLSGNGLGLVGLKERAASLGGSLRVRPGGGGGTVVEMVLP